MMYLTLGMITLLFSNGLSDNDGASVNACFLSGGTVSMICCTTTCTDVSKFTFFDDWVKLHTVLP